MPSARPPASARSQAGSRPQFPRSSLRRHWSQRPPGPGPAASRVQYEPQASRGHPGLSPDSLTSRNHGGKERGGAAGAQRRGLIMAAGANVWGSPSLTTPPSGPPTYGSLLLCPFSRAGSSHSHAPSAPPHRLRPPSPRAAPPPSCRGLLLLLLLA